MEWLWASSPSTLANSATYGADLSTASRFIRTTLVRRWNWSARRPENDLPAPVSYTHLTLPTIA